MLVAPKTSGEIKSAVRALWLPEVISAFTSNAPNRNTIGKFLILASK